MAMWRGVWEFVRPAVKPVVATVVACAALSAVGRYLGPAWKPTELADTIEPATQEVSIGDDGAAPGLVGTYEVAFSDEVLTLADGTEVKVRITYPVGRKDPAPGVVFLHGAGTHTHDQAFAQQTADFASAGIITIVPERGSAMYSTSERDYLAMAQDYLQVWEYLRTWAGGELVPVDSARVGLYAESEGAWIAPVMAAQQPEISFVVLASAPVVPGRDQFALAADTYLRNTHVPEQVNRIIPRLLGGKLPGGFDYVDFDALGYTAQMKQPVLMVYGTGDTSMPLVQGPLATKAALAQAGNHQWMLRYFPGANHGLKLGEQLAPGFSEAVATWIHDPQGGQANSAQIAGATPQQTYVAQTPPSPYWFADGWLKLAMPVVPILLIGAGFVVDGMQRRRHEILRPAPTRWAAGLTLAQLGGLGLYVSQVAKLALNYQTNDVVTQAGWYGLQVVAAFGAGTTVYSIQLGARTWYSNQGGTSQYQIPVGLVLTQAGAVLALTYGAYWGLFPLLDR